MGYRPTAKDWHVSIDSVEFTDEHLKKHLIIFNDETQPEYFTEFEHKGILYFDTRLVSTELLKGIGQSLGGEQAYRPTKNEKYSEIEKSVRDDGVDLRKKPLQIVVELDDKDEIVKVEKMFNGNSLNDILDNNSNLNNRLCAIFTKKQDYSEAHMVSIGTNQNNLEKPFGPCTEENLKSSLEKMIDLDAFPLPNKPTYDETVTWYRKVTEEIKFITNDKMPSKAKLKKLLDSLFTKVLPNLNTNRSFSSGAEALEILRTKGYVDTPTVLYGCYAANYTMVWPAMRVLQNDVVYQDFNFKTGSVDLIIHLSQPDMTNPIEWFFETALDFWNKWKKLNEFVNPDLPMNLRIIGAYQPLDCLNHIWEIDTHVPFEEIVKFKGDKTMDELKREISRLKKCKEEEKEEDDDFDKSLKVLYMQEEDTL